MCEAYFSAAIVHVRNGQGQKQILPEAKRIDSSTVYGIDVGLDYLLPISQLQIACFSSGARIEDRTVIVIPSTRFIMDGNRPIGVEGELLTPDMRNALIRQGQVFPRLAA